MNRAFLALLATGLLFPQAPPQFAPDDTEGLVMWPNGRGRYAWKRKGHWQSPPLIARNGRPAAPAEVAAMTATLTALGDTLKATPTGSTLTGFWVKESRGYLSRPAIDLPPGVAPTSVPFHFETGVFPFLIEDVLTNGKFVQANAGETESIYYEFNVLPGKFSRSPVATETNPAGQSLEFYTRPQIISRFAGFPVYDGQDLVITRQNRDPYAPAPLGRVLKAALPLYEKDRASAESRLANLKTENAKTQSPEYEQRMREQLEKNYGSFRTSSPSRWQTRLTSMENELNYNRELAAKKANPQKDKEGSWYWNAIDAHAEASRRLAALTPADAARPACFLKAADNNGRYAIKGDILPAGQNPQCEELVSDNYAYFDPKLPRTAAQILRVHSIGRCAYVTEGKPSQSPVRRQDVPPQGCYKHVPMWQELDWTKVAALLPK